MKLKLLKYERTDVNVVLTVRERSSGTGVVADRAQRIAESRDKSSVSPPLILCALELTTR